jgi:hypothetical protein
MFFFMVFHCIDFSLDDRRTGMTLLPIIARWLDSNTNAKQKRGGLAEKQANQRFG